MSKESKETEGKLERRTPEEVNGSAASDLENEGHGYLEHPKGYSEGSGDKTFFRSEKRTIGNLPKLYTRYNSELLPQRVITTGKVSQQTAGRFLSLDIILPGKV